jgi:hypothetical protein
MGLPKLRTKVINLLKIKGKPLEFINGNFPRNFVNKAAHQKKGCADS